MLSDFVKKVISAVEVLVYAVPKQMISIKDTDSNHIYCSPYLLDLMEARNDQVIGTKIWTRRTLLCRQSWGGFICLTVSIMSGGSRTAAEKRLRSFYSITTRYRHQNP